MAEHFAHVVKGSGPGILLAHGGGGSIAGNYGPILDDLATTHTVVGPDYPGSGDTPRSPEPLVLDDVADTLVRTAVDAGVDRFTVLGYSLGTAVAVRIAVRHPERVTGLVLTAGFTYPDTRMRLAVEVWRGLLAAGDRTLLARYLTANAGRRDHRGRARRPRALPAAGGRHSGGRARRDRRRARDRGGGPRRVARRDPLAPRAGRVSRGS
jgi:pimeloyl-ACP methyl ester carboxylesterase